MPEGAAQADSESEQRTVQQYIDEVPAWPDGTPAPASPMTGMQWRVWWLAAIGKFFEGYVVFVTGVALPLIYREFAMSPAETGFVSAAPLAGILIGATALGGIADRLGRKPVFIAEMVIFISFVAGLMAAPSLPVVLLCLFGIGIALGADYPTAHMIISEAMPSRSRGRLVLGAFGFQALGAMTAVGAGYVILVEQPDLAAWRTMYAVIVIPAALVAVGRLFMPESAQWLMARGETQRAERSILRLLARVPQYPQEIRLHKAEAGGAAPRQRRSWRALFGRGNRRALALSSIPWFLQDIGTYGIGIFTPTIIAVTLGHAAGPLHTVAGIVHHDLIAAKAAILIDLLLIVGIVGAVLLADRVGRIRLQIIGFVGCAIGLALAALSSAFAGTGQILLIFLGFMTFNFMTNLGPNAQTYLIAGEVFPTGVRGRGAGFAASVGKIGAVSAAFLMPVLLAGIGRTALLGVLVVTSLVGAWVTWQFRIETRGADLEALHAGVPGRRP